MKRKLLALFITVVIVTSVSLVAGVLAAPKPPPLQTPLGGNKIAQFVDPLPDLHVIPAGTNEIVLEMTEFQSPVMPTGFKPANGLPYTGTYVWGYKDAAGQTATSYIGPVVVAQRGTPTQIKYVNKLGTTATSKLLFWKPSTDQTLHWADPANVMSVFTNYDGPIPAVPHLHGGEVPPSLDGGPDAWFYDPALKPADTWSTEGHGYYSKNGPNTDGSATYRYPNTQEAAPIWFHDHLLGATRLNVYAGLAGAYLIQDAANDPPNLPPLIPLVIQDRMFDTNGQLYFPNVGINPEHPFWIPEFVGDTIVVNGKVWPYKNVDRQRYEFLFLNGSNARAYDMFLQEPVSGVKGPRMWVIGTDGGYLDAPVLIDPNATKKAGQQSLVMMPGERYMVIVDFNDPVWLANLAAAGVNTSLPINLILRNTAKTPYPAGAPAVQSTTGKIIQFRVSTITPGDTSFNPASTVLPPPLRTGLNTIKRLVDPVLGTINPLVTVQKNRSLTLNEVMGVGGPLEVLVNNTKWAGTNRPDFVPVTVGGVTTYYSEVPKEGDTEIWEIVNLTADAHPIHLHLVQFQLMNRQAFDVVGYNAIYNAAFPGGLYLPGYGPPLNYNTGNPQALGGNPAVPVNLFKGAVVPPLPYEAGWKDTVIAYPGQVTRIAVRWAPTDSDLATQNAFPFDPNGGHGYVWHCHIIDHEDNEMMRPTQVDPIDGAPRTYIIDIDY